MTASPSFVFRDAPTFWWPVTVRYPGDGEMIERTFKAQFKAQDEDELFSRAGALSEDDGDGIAELISNDRKRLQSVLCGWEGISVEGGGDLEFTLENAEMVLRQRPVRIALGKAYSEAMLDQEETRAGN